MKAILTLIAISLTFMVKSQTIYSKVKIYTDQAGITLLLNQGVAVDRGKRKEGEFIITDLSQEDIAKVQELQFDHEILVSDVTKYYVEQNKQSDNLQKNGTCTGTTGTTVVDPTHFNIPTTYGGYFKYSEILAQLDLMAELYPHLISTKQPISTFVTWENRPIYHVKISNNPSTDNGAPKIMYTALHHSREPMSMMHLIYYMWFLLENYDVNPEVKFLVDNTQMFFIPCVNPDGYIYNQTTNPNGGGMHRKNRNPNIGTTNKGVDLNRNYGYGWGTTGISNQVNNDSYPGTSAFSEPETQAMRWFVQNHHIRAALNSHTYGDMLLFPIGTTTAEYADHHDYFQALANHMVQYNGYEASKSSELYPASGDSDDYMYKVDNGVNQKDTVFAMTPEIGSAFWPATSEILPNCREMLFVNLALAHSVHKYYLVKDIDPQHITTTAGNFNHSIKKLGRMAGPATVAIEPLLNISQVGSPITYNFIPTQTSEGQLAYELPSNITNGAQIKYVLTVDDGLWIYRDTITKYYGNTTEEEVIFEDNATSSNNWTGNWSTTTSSYYSAPRCFTDSPSGQYANNLNSTFTLTQTLDLTDVETAFVSFYAKWDIETNYDFCQFQVSTDNGATWIGQCGLYTSIAGSTTGSIQPQGQPIWHGSKTTWVQEKINLSDYIGETIKVRYQLKSDQGTRKDGFYFDDFKVVVTYPTPQPPDDEPGDDPGEEPGEEEENPGQSNVGITDATLPKIVLYPNPADKVISIRGTTYADRIEITDLSGVLFHSSPTYFNNTMKISVDHLAAGTYFIKISHTGTGYTSIQKFIKR